MIPVTIFRNRTVAVFGLARTGLEAARALMAGGAEVICADDARPRVAAAAGQGFPTGDLAEADWSGIAALVLSPGVPLTHPEPHWTVERAREAGVEIIGDTELFFRERAARAPGSPVVAVTGTNGKSTVTALIGHILRACGRDAAVGGNIGAAVLGLEGFAASRIHVLEMSSFQIDLTPTLAPTVGVHLNVTPDHLDRHGTLEAYAAIKSRIVADAETAVIAVDDDWTRGTADNVARRGGRLIRVSTTDSLTDGVFSRDGKLFTAEAGQERELADISDIATLRGAHNAQNAAAAAAAALALGTEADAIAAALATFPGLAHRMERIGRLGKVSFVNDSKATNAEAASRAVGSFDAVYWVAGGRPKQLDLEPLEPCFPRIRRAFLIGEAAPAMAEALGQRVPHEISGELSRAVLAAAAAASADPSTEPVVLLSPACTSFDQFADFEARGEAFRRLVSGLDGVVMDAREAA